MTAEQFNLDQYKALVNLKEYSEEQYRKACEVLQNALAEKDNQINNLIQERDGILYDCVTRTTELNELKIKYSEKQRATSLLREEIRALTAQNSGLRERIKYLKSETDSKINNLTHERDEFRHEAASLGQLNSEYRQQLKEFEQLKLENNGLRERIKYLDEQIVGYRAANAKLTSKVEQGGEPEYVAIKQGDNFEGACEVSMDQRHWFPAELLYINRTLGADCPFIAKRPPQKECSGWRFARALKNEPTVPEVDGRPR